MLSSAFSLRLMGRNRVRREECAGAAAIKLTGIRMEKAPFAWEGSPLPMHGAQLGGPIFCYFRQFSER